MELKSRLSDADKRDGRRHGREREIKIRSNFSGGVNPQIETSMPHVFNEMRRHGAHESSGALGGLSPSLHCGREKMKEDAGEGEEEEEEEGPLRLG